MHNLNTYLHVSRNEKKHWKHTRIEGLNEWLIHISTHKWIPSNETYIECT